MADQIARRNERARAAAEKAGRSTFHCEVVEYWPACTTCGKPIRPSLWTPTRLCGCPGVHWTYHLDGWERVLATPADGTPS